MTEQEKEIAISDLKKDVEKLKANKKDGWDKSSIVFGIIGSVLLPIAIAFWGTISTNRNNKINQAEMINNFIDHLTDTSEVKRELSLITLKNVLDDSSLARSIIKKVSKSSDSATQILAKVELANPTLSERDVLNEWVIKISNSNSFEKAESNLTSCKTAYENSNDYIWTNDIYLVRNPDSSNSWLVVLDAFTGSSDSTTVSNELTRIKSLPSLQRVFDNASVIYYSKDKFAKLYGRID
jgi:hypothetical protein